MALDPVEVLGLAAGIVSTSAALPQLVKIIRTRRAADVSLAMFVIALAGAVMWLAYGLLKPAPSIVFWNIVGALQMSVIVAVKLLHDSRARIAAAAGAGLSDERIRDYRLPVESGVDDGGR